MSKTARVLLPFLTSFHLTTRLDEGPEGVEEMVAMLISRRNGGNSQYLVSFHLNVLQVGDGEGEGDEAADPRLGEAFLQLLRTNGLQVGIRYLPCAGSETSSNDGADSDAYSSDESVCYTAYLKVCIIANILFSPEGLKQWESTDRRSKKR